MRLFDLFRPRFLFTASSYLLPLFAMCSITLLLAGFFFAAYSDTDLQQGESYRIIFLHVPSAWISLSFYAGLALFSLCYLLTHTQAFFFLALTLARIGAIFSLITLITGSLWGKMSWGTYWVWDARLTSVLVLFFLYLGFLFLYQAHESTQKAMFNSSLLGMIGFLNLPIIKFSVEWWNTLHQSSSISLRTGNKDNLPNTTQIEKIQISNNSTNNYPNDGSNVILGTKNQQDQNPSFSTQEIQILPNSHNSTIANHNLESSIHLPTHGAGDQLQLPISISDHFNINLNDHLEIVDTLTESNATLAVSMDLSVLLPLLLVLLGFLALSAVLAIYFFRRDLLQLKLIAYYI